jgi:HlyD family secretion protein
MLGAAAVAIDEVDDKGVALGLGRVGACVQGQLVEAGVPVVSADQVKRIKMQLTDRADDPDVRDIVASETKLFEVRVFGRAGQKSQLRERVSQLNEEIAGLTAQEQAKDKETALVEKELVGVRQLYEQRLIQISRLTVLERDHARLSGERAQYIAARAQARGKITETELQIIQIDKDVVSEVSKTCARPTTRSASSSSARSPPRSLRRIDIRARRTASCCSRRFTPWAASSPPATPS